MEFNAYKLSYYLNAQHSFDNQRCSMHSHTFVISLYLEDQRKNDFIDFHLADSLVNYYLGQFRGQYLNEIAPFDKMIPTIENLGSVFYEHLKDNLREYGYDLIQIDISENPIRVYSISDRLYLGRKLME